MELPTTTIPAGTAPVVASAPAPTPAPAPSRPDAKSIMSQLSSSDRLLAATGRFREIKPSASAPAQAAPVAPSAPVNAPATPVAEVVPVAPANEAPAPAPVTPESQPGTEESNPGNGDKGKRFRFSSDDDQAVAQLAKSRGIPLVEAARIYAGETPPQPAARPAAPVAVPAVDTALQSYDKRATETQEQIAALVTKRNAASEDLDHKAANELSDQIADLKVDLRLLKDEKQGYLRNVDQQEQSSKKSAAEEARNRVFTKYPVLASETSMARLALNEYVNRAIADPARASERADPRFAENLADEFATKHGIQSATSAGTAPVAAAPVARPSMAKPQPQQVQPAGARLLTGADGHSTPSASSPLTKEQVLHLVRTDPEARRAIMRQNFRAK